VHAKVFAVARRIEAVDQLQSAIASKFQSQRSTITRRHAGLLGEDSGVGIADRRAAARPAASLVLDFGFGAF